jgi:hypothetical protein
VRERTRRGRVGAARFRASRPPARVCFCARETQRRRNERAPAACAHARTHAQRGVRRVKGVSEAGARAPVSDVAQAVRLGAWQPLSGAHQRRYRLIRVQQLPRSAGREGVQACGASAGAKRHTHNNRRKGAFCRRSGRHALRAHAAVVRAPASAAAAGSWARPGPPHPPPRPPRTCAANRASARRRSRAASRAHAPAAPQARGAACVGMVGWWSCTCVSTSGGGREARRRRQKALLGPNAKRNMRAPRGEGGRTHRSASRAVRSCAASGGVCGTVVATRARGGWKGE